MASAVTFYDVVVWLHVSAVVVGFGSTFAFGVISAAAARSNPRALPAVGIGIAAASRTLVTIGGVIVLLTGLYLATREPWEFSDFFIAWGIVAVLVLLGLTIGFFGPQGRRAGEAAERDIQRAGAGEVEFGEEFSRLNSKIAAVGAVAGLIIILTIYVMVAKPFL